MSKLYYHKTDGGAEYLCTSPVEGTDEGDLSTAIVRLDGGLELLNPVYETSPELLKALIDLYNVSVKQLDQSATHDGLTNCNALAQARAAIEQAGG